MIRISGSKPPKYLFLIAILSGVFAFIMASMMGPILLTISLIFFLTGGIFGFFQPSVSWRWGLWIAGPIVFLVLLSVLFAGQPDVFIKNDLPVLLLAITAACAGSLILSWYKFRKQGIH